MVHIRSIFVLLVLLLITQNVTAQKAAKREQAIFKKGVSEYRQHHWKTAENIFFTLVEKLPQSSLTTANTLMLAKTYYKMGKYQQSLKVCQTFLNKYPGSAYSDDIQFLMANNYYRLNRLQSALTIWLQVAAKSTDKRLQKKALALARDAMRFKFDEQSLRNLARQEIDPFAKQAVLYYLADRYYHKDRKSLALQMAHNILDIPQGSPEYKEKAQRLIELLEQNASGRIRIAALLPLSGANAKVGKALLDGLRLAQSDYSEANDPIIEIIPYDYETRMTRAIERLKEIAGDPTISAVFGPVENDITVACAAIADYEDLTIISPTASDENLRSLSHNVIQLAVPLDIMARDLARYAADSLHLKRYAILAPIDDYYIRFVKYFKETQLAAGNEISAEQWYYPEEQDITRHFKALKRTGLKLAFQDSVLSVDSTYSPSALDSLYKIHLHEQQELLRETHTRLDSADIPVSVFDGLFMPIYGEDITRIASQFAYWNIRATLLGNQDWYDEDQLKKNRKYINGLTFVADGYLNRESWDFRKFRNEFRMNYKKTPGTYEIIGFDSFNFLLSALADQGNSINRNNIRDAIEEKGLYTGIYRNFNIGTKRYNNASRLLKFTFGQILPLK